MSSLGPWTDTEITLCRSPIAPGVWVPSLPESQQDASRYAGGLRVVRSHICSHFAPTDAVDLQWRRSDADTWTLWARWSE